MALPIVGYRWGFDLKNDEFLLFWTVFRCRIEEMDIVEK